MAFKLLDDIATLMHSEANMCLFCYETTSGPYAIQHTADCRGNAYMSAIMDQIDVEDLARYLAERFPGKKT